MSGADRWSLNGREEYTPGFGLHPTASPIPIPPSSTQRQRRRSPSPYSSTGSGSYSDDRSHASFASSASTAPSLNPRYEYTCSFGFTDCRLSFHPMRINDWISHEASHFLQHRPPPKTCCTFCDLVFENYTDPKLSWRQRMDHIAVHFQRLEGPDHPRPDFFVIEYMFEKRLLSAGEYKSLTRYTERPRCDGLVDIGYKTPEMKRKHEKSREQRYDLEKEDRQRRREGKRR
jgi:hypothetical protein